jgi:hypothetical protein
MRRLRPLTAAAGIVLAAACAWRAPAGTLPAQLSDDAFWRLAAELSEPAGTFTHSDNLVSNEVFFAHTARQLRARGGVYIGVGPEQNFSYITRVEPAMAFIADIRQENRNLHLLYKTLFETSESRAEFLSRLFSRDRPASAGPRSSVDDLFAAFDKAPSSGAVRDATAALVRQRLLGTHGWPLTDADLASIDYALEAFQHDGPAIHYGRSRPGSEPGPSYRTLMTARDVSGLPRSYLADEKAFGFVKQLHAKNLIVPVVGDFGGPGVIARIGEYVRRHDSHVSAFYGSNVEVYLSKPQMASYCDSLASLPVEWRTWFIGGRGAQPLASKLRTCPRDAKPLEWRPPS